MKVFMNIIYGRRYYLIFGALFFIFWFLFKVGGNPHIGKALASTAIDVVMAMIILVITVDWLLPRLVYKNKYGLFMVTYLLLLFIGGSVIILCQLKLFGSSLGNYRQNVAKSPEHYFYWFWSDLILGSYFLVFFISAAGAAIHFAIDRLKNISLIQQLEKEKLNAELDSLKNQINPHFLFNALNTIYYKIEKQNLAARETLQLFSKMLRYQLYECNQPLITIENELNFLKSYIELQKERMNPCYEISYTGFNEISGFFISPFLLMPIIENCFKHLADNDQPGNSICIQVKSDDQYFYLSTSNDNTPKDNGALPGIGLRNIKKRLDLIYPGMHELVIQSVGSRFEVKLKIMTQ